MGSGHTKDGFIDMFVETTQQIYVPGACVQGVVHINCKDNRNYNLLQLRLNGVEHVHWSEGSGKNRRSYSNTKVTYNACFQLAVFAQRVIPGGHYSFPFKFILPSQITGSMFQSQDNYIRYQAIAELIPSDDKNDIQTFVKNLNILQPCRQVSGPAQNQQISNPQCCGCCKGYGTVKISMTCDKKIVKEGDKIYVTGLVDNSQGTEEITNCEISFQDIRWRVSSAGSVRRNIMGNYPLFMIPTPVLKGERREFTFSATIPSGLAFSTSIGSIVSRYQILNFSGNMGCCSSGANCEFLMWFQCSNPQLEKGPKVPQPPGWNPKVAKEVFYTNFPGFHYQPTPGIPYLNRAGMTNINNLTAMNNEMGYYQQPINSYSIKPILY